MSDSIKKFEEQLLKGLHRACYTTKTCKDSSKEQVILMNGKRISLNNKSVWSSKLYAEKTIKIWLLDGSQFWVSNNNVWRRTFGYNKPVCITAEIEARAKLLRAEWVRKNISIVPLMDFMVFEYKRNGGE